MKYKCRKCYFAFSSDLTVRSSEDLMCPKCGAQVASFGDLAEEVYRGAEERMTGFEIAYTQSELLSENSGLPTDVRLTYEWLRTIKILCREWDNG